MPVLLTFGLRPLEANKTDLIFFYFDIRGKMSILQCDKYILQFKYITLTIKLLRNTPPPPELLIFQRKKLIPSLVEGPILTGSLLRGFLYPYLTLTKNEKMIALCILANLKQFADVMKYKNEGLTLLIYILNQNATQNILIILIFMFFCLYSN